MPESSLRKCEHQGAQGIKLAYPLKVLRDKINGTNLTPLSVVICHFSEGLRIPQVSLCHNWIADNHQILSAALWGERAVKVTFGKIKGWVLCLSHHPLHPVSQGLFPLGSKQLENLNIKPLRHF